MNIPLEYAIFVAVLLGLAFGSFGSVLVYRFPTNGTVFGRSKCPACRHTLQWMDLIPVFSALFLRRRCRYCKTKISWQYPLLESVTALVFALIVARFGEMPWIALALLAIASYMLILISFYDFETQKIPDLFVIILMLAALIMQAVLAIEGSPLLIRNAFVGAAIPFVFFGGLWLMSGGRWIGSGDVLLGTAVGLLLGTRLVVIALFFAYLLGAGVAVHLLITGKVQRGATIAFGPFIAMGALIALFIGDAVFTSYTGILFL